MTTLRSILPIDLARVPVGPDWPVDASQVAACLAALLNVPVGNLALSGWIAHEEVRRARERTRVGPGRETIQLLEHQITSEHHPQVDLVFAGATRTLLELDLTVEIEVSGVALTIEHGEIIDSEPGQVTASATLTGAGFVLARCETTPVDLAPQTSLDRAS